MESGSGGNAPDDHGDGDHKAILESGGNPHHQQPFEQSSGHNNSNNNYQHISTKIIIRKTIPYLFSLALACILLYQSSDHIADYFLISYHPFSGESQNSTIQSNPSGPEDNFSKGNLSLPSNDSSTANVEENLSSDSSSPTHVPPGNGPSSLANEGTEETKLQNVLNKAAMVNKTVIVTTINSAWAAPNSIFDLFLESFKIGNETQKFLNHLVVIALDQNSYNRCLELHPYCYALRTEGIDFSIHEAYFMRPDYVELVWRKIEFMHTILKLGYNAIFTDTDIMWFRDPFLHFLEDADMQTASDHYWGTPNDGISNTGFYYVKSNNHTIIFYELWLTSRHIFKHQHDQDVFNMLLVDPLTEKIGIKIRLLDPAFYGGFCEPSDDLNLVCTMHANCCAGLGSKLYDLRLLLEDWKNYMALPSDERAKIPQTWTLQRECHG